MRQVASIALIILSYFGYGHDIKMAIFEIYEGNAGLEMKISIDKDDFLKTLAQEFPTTFSNNKITDHAHTYFGSHVTITVNGKCTSFKIKEVRFSETNIHLTGTLNLQVDEVREVRVTNTCMVDLYKDHDNIIKLRLNEKNRSFRLNKDRTSTVATYS